MRFALPKNRTAPLIVFAILGIIVSLTLGVYHINRMVHYSYRSQCEDYKFLTNNAAALLKQEINNNYQALQASANYIANGENFGKESTEELLKLLNTEQGYVDVAIVDKSGIGYNSKGVTIDLSGEDYVINALSGKKSTSNKLVYNENNTPVMIYAVPIEKDGSNIGVLTASQSAEFNSITLLDQEIKEGRLIYVINENNEPVAYIKGMDISKFNYDEIIQQGDLFEDTMSYTAAISLNSLLTKKETKGSFIWNKVPLGVNNWYVLVGSRYTINATTRDILNLTNLMWFIITTATLLMFILMIVTQVRSNRKVISTLYLDPVTGGDNWYKFRMNANKILSGKQFTKKNFALVNFDINRFKIINDAYGYQKGDEVLKDIYNVIKRWSLLGEPFTRYAADQFYILMSFSEQEELTQKILDLNERIRQLRYTKAARIFYGVYFVTETKDSIDRMGEFAQVAKNNIKGSSEGIISFFDDTARGRLLEEEEIEKSMNEALKNDEFQVYLQPKYMAKEEIISGAEALVRWKSSNGMPFSPGDFIPLFEKNGFITELDYYMLKKVCQLIRGWLDKGYNPLPISVNISRLHFANAHLAEIITDIVDSFDVPRNLIELELTESAFLQNKQMLIDTVVRLREYGFLVSMDDFGAGYSSLNSLKDLPLDTVKLDGELFRMTDEVERGLCVIRNTITMAKDLHMKVVAECIETREQVEFLCMVGCDVIQGYYFAKPMPADQFEERYYSFQVID
ncbi:MAG: putative signaling protein [Herbinix sp.]|jgi:diguanylate cyclase (GGDEF)-like protein|nr:putative signaling protein [Herbinix sp.]